MEVVSKSAHKNLMDMCFKTIKIDIKCKKSHLPDQLTYDKQQLLMQTNLQHDRTILRLRFPVLIDHT